jgi:hypothetical protein
MRSLFGYRSLLEISAQEALAKQISIWWCGGGDRASEAKHDYIFHFEK